MKPIIALIGRPNVGKSTLFNLLTNKKDSLVGNYPRLTRDKKYGNIEKQNIKYTIIDTGGINGHEKGLEIKVAKQSFSAIEECNIVFFIMNAREGLSYDDILINKKLRLFKKKVYFILNKTEGLECDFIKSEFYSLGINKLYTISATNNLGIKELFREISLNLSKNYEKLTYLNNKYFISKKNYKKKLTISLVGCKNVGKSTLINNFIKTSSLLSSNQPGTTIENIYNTKIFNKNYLTVIDTAGFSKINNKNEIEKASINKIFQAIKESNILILVADINKNISKQDLHLIKIILNRGKFLIIVLNKCDSFNKKKN